MPAFVARPAVMKQFAARVGGQESAGRIGAAPADREGAADGLDRAVGVVRDGIADDTEP